MSSYHDESVDSLPAFDLSKSMAHIKKVSSDTSSFEYVITSHLRMSGIYWGLTTMCILGRDLRTEMSSDSIVDWVMKCYHSDCGGFSGGVDHDPHILYTLSALQILAICDKLSLVNYDMVENFVVSMQQEDGSFQGDIWGERDTRFSYCAFQTLAILGRMPTLPSPSAEDKRVEEEDKGEGERRGIDIVKAVDYIKQCINFDGGFGAVPSAESHAGQIFCCIGALSIANALYIVDVDQLGWWLSERQCDSGGLNGRPEKQADVCYSWWILSSLSILGRISWIDNNKLIRFILQCQDPEDGGFSDRPGNMGDIFHTFFAIAGLSLLGYFVDDSKAGMSNIDTSNFRGIDPTYALPIDVVEKLNMPKTVLKL